MDQDPRDTRPPPKVGERRRRIRSWAILIALMAMAGFVYAIAIVRMVQSRTLPHFF
ncbi:MAG: hypothetical protein ACREFN_05780 [Acetobacteraceae bacterium]